MTYVKNNSKYALSFKVEKDGKETRFSFDCKRIYQDTGNIATTGVTPIDENDYDFLYKNCKQFQKHVDSGELEKTKESGATTVANKMDSLEKENKILKQQLAEKTKEASTATSEELDSVKAENESLKAQLEALKKGKKSTAKKTDKEEVKEEVDENEGF